jgi:hypothetical protein
LCSEGLAAKSGFTSDNGTAPDEKAPHGLYFHHCTAIQAFEGTPEVFEGLMIHIHLLATERHFVFIALSSLSHPHASMFSFSGHQRSLDRSLMIFQSKRFNRIHKAEEASCPLQSPEDLSELLNSKEAKKYDPHCIDIVFSLEQSVYREIAHFPG